MTNQHQLKCRECGKLWGNRPVSICEACFSPVELAYDLDAIREAVTPDDIARRSPNLWRYAELLPLPEGFEPPLPAGFTPLVDAPRLGKQLGLSHLYLKNDGVCFPTLSFKDRVVALALAQARRFGFESVGCSSTGNLANAVAAQARRLGLDAWVFIPADLEAAKILNSQVYGAHVVRIAGNYDQVNRLCVQVADQFRWGFVNVNLRAYYSEGSKTFGYEIAEQLGWRLPDNVVVPMAGASLITKIAKAFRELVKLGWVEAKPVKFFGAQATGCSPVTTAVKRGESEIEPQKPQTVARSLAIGNPSDGHYAIKVITESGGWGEDVADAEIVRGIQLVAETEGIFTETAGGVTVGVTKKLIEQGRIGRDELTVLALTGNGLKTTDALAGAYTRDTPIPARLAAFEEYLGRTENQHALAVAQ
jgi:threonine synthase